jgi:hypothetical protein
VARTAHSPSSSGGTSHSSRPANLDESIKEMRQIADGPYDILAEAAGITASSWCASPATHVGYELIGAGMLILAGGPGSAHGLRRAGALDAGRVPAWNEVTARGAVMAKQNSQVPAVLTTNTRQFQEQRVNGTGQIAGPDELGCHVAQLCVGSL